MFLIFLRLFVTPKDKNRILVLIPGRDARGGITTYYQTLAPLFTLPIDYLERGARNWPIKSNLFSELIRLIRDFYRFFKAIRTGKYSIVQTNTSFSSLAIIRDGIYLVITRIYKLKTIVFFRGWDYKFAEKIEKKYLRIFKYVYFNSNAIIDLAQTNVSLLKDWGYKKQIYLETTVVDKNQVGEISENQISKKYYSKDFNLLFLDRLEKAKGIYEALSAFVILKKRYPNLKMTIAGDGEEAKNIKMYIKIKKIDNITMTGFINGKQKNDVFNAADIYLFPSYGEGMPSSLIEAMAFGLPVVTRNVGGISDFFINNRNGYITESKDPVVLASMIELIITNIENAKAMALCNYKYAKEKFYSDKVVIRMQNILLNVLNE
jgi:glycosyltransferase involved in cell wall biosynthesis